ncbi:MAG: peptidase [Nitrosopumilaceae archaeon]|jgi:hypothetical protein
MYFSRIMIPKFSILIGFSVILASSFMGLEAYGNPSFQSNVLIPQEEFLGYFDSNGIYTVVGNVKNLNDFGIIPTITISVKEDSNIFTKTIQHIPLGSEKEIPFKVKFYEVRSKTPILLSPNLTFVKTQTNEIPIEVIYDETLIKYDDGHLTGRIINTGNHTIYFPKVYAVVHGYEMVLDIVQNMDFIEKIDPGETVEFSMYPDPVITKDIFYYSCFAVTDSFVRPMHTERNGEKFYFRYDAGTWFTSPQFNDQGTELTLRTVNSFPLETYANFEFPVFSEDEKFNVFVNGDEKKTIQSIDDRGNWHVAYNVEPRETGEILITGFKEGWNPGDRIFIPDWVKANAFGWGNDQANDDVFIRGLEFMIKEKIIIIPENIQTQGEVAIPDWVKNPSTWWSEDKIDNETFVNVLEYLINKGIIKI